MLGVLVERQMLCKFCQNPSFLGEWNTPKETQNLPEKICEVCNEKVDTDTLVQQREEKRGNFSHIEGWVNGHAMIEFFFVIFEIRNFNLWEVARSCDCVFIITSTLF